MLPKIDQPYYSLTLPISKLEVHYRPFLVKEEKILLLALDSKMPKDLMDAVRQILINCIQETHLVDSMNILDAMFLMLRIRSASRGNVIHNVTLRCLNKVDGKTCNHKQEIELDLNDAKLSHPIPENRISITDKIGMIMKVPDLSVFELYLQDITPEVNDKLVLSYTESIYDENMVYKLKDVTPEEFGQWLDKLQDTQFDQIESFIMNQPKIVVEYPFHCDMCGHEEVKQIDRLLDFF